MTNIIFKDLLEFEQELIDCLFYYYADQSKLSEVDLDVNVLDESIPRIMLTDLNLIERNALKDRLQCGDFVLNEVYVLHQQLLGQDVVSVPISQIQIANLWQQVETLKNEFEQLNKKTQSARYREILISYMSFDRNICTGYNSAIKKRIQGVQAIQVRYEKKLYPKHRIIEQILQAGAKENGGWSNLNQAVSCSMDKIRVAFLEFDLELLRHDIEHKNKQIEQIRQLRKTNQNRENQADVRRQQRTFQNRIKKFKAEISAMEKILNMENPQYGLEHLTPYSTLYDQESIINHLRGRHDLLKNILIKSDRKNKKDHGYDENKTECYD